MKPVRSGKTRQLGAMAAAVALTAVLPYIGAVGHGFVYDDHMVVQENPTVLEGRFGGAFLAPYHAGVKVGTGLYRPLTILSLALNHAVGGLDPMGYHAVNIALHALVCLSVLGTGLALGLGAPAAWISAMLFAVHPVHVEAVAYVSGRAELLSALFFLLALWAHVGLRTAAGRPTWIGLVASSASFFLALAAKENAVTFPLVVLAWEAVGREPEASARTDARVRKRAIAWRTGFLLVPLLAYLFLRHHALGRLLLDPSTLSHVENPAAAQGMVVRWATAVAVFWRVALLLVVPWKLSPDYSYAEIVAVTSPLVPSFALGCAVVALVAWALWASARRSRVAAFLILFTLATYSIVSNVFVVIGTILAERLLYLPSAGICLLGGLLFGVARRRSPRWAAAATALVLTLATVRAVTWSAVWRDNFTLFSAAARSAPRSVKVLGNLAAWLALRGRLEEARGLLVEALALAPDSLANRFNLAKILFRLDDLNGAEREIRAVLAGDARDGFAWAQLGLVLQRRGDGPGAEAAFRHALELEPGASDARLGLAWFEVDRGDLDAAERELTAVLAAEPESVTALHGLGVVALRREGWDEALGWLTRAARLDPQNTRILCHLARALGATGRTDQAVEVYRRALQVDPQDAEATEAVRRLTSPPP